ncbi:MAG: EFR1 family ferrodoxin [Anaerovoracaceae bacterium]|jgi:ferredoxin/flavodoxin
MNVNAVYFSGTGTTKKVVEAIADRLAQDLNNGGGYSTYDFTPKAAREEEISFGENDLVVIGTPVYAGRVPNVLLKYMDTIKGNGATAVCIVLYGNRNFDDGLIELRNIMADNGFKVIAAGGFIGEHSFSTVLAAGRPDAADMEIAIGFADQIAEKVKSGREYEGKIKVRGEEPYRKYYMPKDKEGNPVDFRKIKPKTNSDCMDCKHCADICPMQSIDYDDTSLITGICIKCGACVKQCPVSAKYYDDEGYLRHKLELEEEFTMRKEPELFI